jgi:hypothetical protein
MRHANVTVRVKRRVKRTLENKARSNRDRQNEVESLAAARTGRASPMRCMRLCKHGPFIFRITTLKLKNSKRRKKLQKSKTT